MARHRIEPGTHPLLQGANPEQEAVIRHVAGPLLVASVAGSGKTFALIRRVVWLVNVVGIIASKILAVTFSKKAADEMNSRLLQLVGDDLDVDQRPRIGTFHSWAYEVIRTEVPAYREWTVDDRDRYRTYIKDAVGFRGMSWRTADVTSLAAYIGFAKGELAKPGTSESLQLAKRWFGHQADLADDAYSRAEQRRRDERVLTFDDMLVTAHDLLIDPNTGALDRWAGRYDYVLQDEAQDVNRAQNELAILLAKQHRNYMIVGDPAQTIFTFRGARPEYLLDFEHQWQASVIHMHRNYRCGRKIIALANRVISPAVKRLPIEMTAERDTDGTVTFQQSSEFEEEADALVQRLQQLHEDKIAWRDMAVLCRVNAQSRAPEESLLKARIPYVVVGGVNFYDRKEVKDLLAYLRLAEGRGKDDDVRRAINAPFRFLGRAFTDRLMELRGDGRSWQDRVRDVSRQAGIQRRQQDSASDWARLLETMTDQVQQGAAPAAVLEDLVNRTGYCDWLRKEEGEETTENSRVSNVRELIRAAGRFTSVKDLLDYIDEVLTASRKAKKGAESGEQPDRVTVMTIHRSKGLEWPAVCVIGFNEGILPHGRAEDEEEERRLAYVAITRARDHLYLSAVERFAAGSRVVPAPISRYLMDAAEENLIPGLQGVAAQGKILFDDPAQFGQDVLTDENGGVR